MDRDYDAMERSIQELKKEEESMKEALKQAEKLSESSEINPGTYILVISWKILV